MVIKKASSQNETCRIYRKQEAGVTCGGVDRPLDQVVVLVDPLPVALEVDLRGRRGAAAQRHRRVLHQELVLRLQQEVRQQVGEGGRKRRRGGLRPWRQRRTRLNEEETRRRGARRRRHSSLSLWT